MGKKRVRKHGTSSGIRKLKVSKGLKLKSRKYGGNLISTKMLVKDGRKEWTFEDEYKLFKRTRGHSGLNPKPESRGNNMPPWSMCRRYPIGELMSKPITKGN